MPYDAIRSDMRSEALAARRRPEDEIGFYLVASNRELLNHVEALMNRRGVFGVMDSMGRVHYLVDARKGSPYATRKVMATTERLYLERIDGLTARERRIRDAVDDVLAPYDWNRELRGYRLLAEMLRTTATDVSLLNPISKRLYPTIAERYRLKPHQVERNVRYLLDDLRTRADADTITDLVDPNGRLPVGRTIRCLSERVRSHLEDMPQSPADT